MFPVHRGTEQLIIITEKNEKAAIVFLIYTVYKIFNVGILL